MAYHYLKKRGMMISFGNASGPLEPINVQKEIQAKSLFFTRPAGGHYFTEKKELQKLKVLQISFCGEVL